MSRKHSHKVVVIGLIVFGMLLPSAVSIAQDESASQEEQALLRLMELEQSRSKLVDERAQLQQAQAQLEQQRWELEKMRLDLEKEKDDARREIQDAYEELDDLHKESEWITQIFRIENTDARRLSDILQMFGGNIRYSTESSAIIVIGSEDTVAAVEAAIHILDVPSEPESRPNIQLIVYTLEAVVPGGEPEFGEQAVPNNLESVVKELRNVFPYEGFRLVDTLLVRCRDGSHAQTETYLPIATGHEFTRGLGFTLRATTTVTADAQPAGIRDAHPARIRIDDFMFAVSAVSESQPRGKESRQLIALTSEIDMREGQKVVVGKGNAEMSSNALFAVVTAKVVD